MTKVPMPLRFIPNILHNSKNCFKNEGKLLTFKRIRDWEIQQVHHTRLGTKTFAQCREYEFVKVNFGCG